MLIQNRIQLGVVGTAMVLIVVSSGCRFAANRQNSIGRQAYESGQLAQAVNRFQQALNLSLIHI